MKVMLPLLPTTPEMTQEVKLQSKNQSQKLSLSKKKVVLLKMIFLKWLRSAPDSVFQIQNLARCKPETILT